ncbi:hypothetical protein [Bergeyella sp. RCAD1439]|uniref:hypothetical protein n=1 Tax=Bergeyella anatis TaxID=3113737 RepID=UPI002E18EA03|nr:hypothetical protein [Bergeyella sp. RCAD1439]
MPLAKHGQKFQDRLTQQWVIARGRKIDPNKMRWLLGPFGSPEEIGEKFIHQLAQNENLTIRRNCKNTGLLPSFNALNLKKEELSTLPKQIVDFYENTSEYQIKFTVQWNPIFRMFGFLIRLLFGQRLNQLNIPTTNLTNQELESEIIQLTEKNTPKVRYTFWLRKLASTGQVLYSGTYQTQSLPSGTTCIKATFPLPNGNASVFMQPSIGKEKTLVLNSSGTKFGDAGFYFLLNDSQNQLWARFIPSFTDKLTLQEHNENQLIANQILKLWQMKVVSFHYEITKRPSTD